MIKMHALTESKICCRDSRDGSGSATATAAAAPEEAVTSEEELVKSPKSPKSSSSFPLEGSSEETKEALQLLSGQEGGLNTGNGMIMYRAEKKSWYVVARNFFLLLLNFSPWPCLGAA